MAAEAAGYHDWLDTDAGPVVRPTGGGRRVNPNSARSTLGFVSPFEDLAVVASELQSRASRDPGTDSQDRCGCRVAPARPRPRVVRVLLIDMLADGLVSHRNRAPRRDTYDDILRLWSMTPCALTAHPSRS